jgi:hypothetical protein
LPLLLLPLLPPLLLPPNTHAIIPAGKGYWDSLLLSLGLLLLANSPIIL